MISNAQQKVILLVSERLMMDRGSKTWSGLTTLLCFSLAASAHASLNQFTRQALADFAHSRSENEKNVHVHEVNLVARSDANGQLFDSRGMLSTKGPEIGLTNAEMLQMRKTIGDVVCPGRTRNGKLTGSGGTAIIVGDGRQLLTNAHIFVDEFGENREPLSQCFFQNKEIPFKRIFLDIDAKKLRLFTRNTKNEFYLDVALVLLRVPVKGVKTFRFDETGIEIRNGDEVIMVSADQDRMPALPPKNREAISLDATTELRFEYNLDPIVQICTTKAVSGTTELVPTLGIYSDCQATIGASGSPVFVRLNGELMIKGIHAGGGKESADNRPFSLDKNNPWGVSFSYAIQIDKRIIDQIEIFALQSK